jgi:ArsR family transcriptional regulator
MAELGAQCRTAARQEEVLADFAAGLRPAEPAEIDSLLLRGQAAEATRFLKSLSNPHRLMVLCHLLHGERSVGDLERALGIQQAHLSQQLARLRRDGLVRTRRHSRSIYYSLGSREAQQMIGLLYRLFCANPDA